MDAPPPPPASAPPSDDEPMLVALRRLYRTARAPGPDTRTRRSPGAIAPAGEVGRAVGVLLLGAATHGAGDAEAGAVCGTAAGVARMVEVALARLILHALPPGRRAAEPEARAELRREPNELVASPRARMGVRGAPGELFGRRVPELPSPSWWGRERLCGWPTLVFESVAPPSGEGDSRVWPAVPMTRPGLRFGEAPRRAARRPTPERGLLGFALRALEDELEPGGRHGADWIGQDRPWRGVS